ncbi:hypothetical protein C7974DRAFT_305652 [Boeremia exigua]|uniref:uncharacterized protein n=1 Tax=Boeremia exigua TaxID=749465 RepID=UPI001E8EDE1E|nr:uncharacterized protein C7974DRAFT_305652 [Boeremia exigua]KAH6639106.1 hypothetical protein C7974DRAFT_305652 [Boeremia exigua]
MPPQKIDVHSHFLPPFYRTALATHGHTHPDGMPAIPAWSPTSHLEMMRLANISKSILSISSPGTSLTPSDPALTRSLTRECNAYAAALKREYPDKFGFWASLPLPDIEASLREIEDAVAEGADGFALLTNYHGVYLGDVVFERVFKRLEELGAVVFVHPTTPCVLHGGCASGEAKRTPATPLSTHYPTPVFEFLFDTARAILHLLGSPTLPQCPHLRFIVPHAGGALPPLLTRYVQFSAVVPGRAPLDAAAVRSALDTQFYFDLAGFVFEGEQGGGGQLKALVEGWGVGSGRLLYGSDFPFTQTEFVDMFARRMGEGLGHLFGEEEIGAVYEGNAVGLLGRGMGEGV